LLHEYDYYDHCIVPNGDTGATSVRVEEMENENLDKEENLLELEDKINTQSLTPDKNSDIIYG
jgi:hypothetical protein